MLEAVAARLLSTGWVMRLPIHLYRWHLGSLLGQRFLLLEHTGRITGRPRYVVLEVIARPAPGEWAVVAGFGDRAQWLRNVRASPDVRLTVGRRSTTAIARVLDPADGRGLLADYGRSHPRQWARFRPVLERTLGASLDSDAVRVVEFTATD